MIWRLSALSRVERRLVVVRHSEAGEAGGEQAEVGDTDTRDIGLGSADTAAAAGLRWRVNTRVTSAASLLALSSSSDQTVQVRSSWLVFISSLLVSLPSSSNMIAPSGAGGLG